VEIQNQLGIYWSQNRATVVCFRPEGRQGEIVDSFTVSIDDPEQQTPEVLTQMIVDRCAEREITFAEAAVALDCSVFMQHEVRSEFTDSRRIAQTIKFDAEEAIAADINQAVLAYRAKARDEEGSLLDVFTAPREVFLDVLIALQNNKIDPVRIEPDISCVGGLLGEKLSGSPGTPGEQGKLAAILSQRRGYFIVFEPDGNIFAQRTVLIGPWQDRGQLLVRQIKLTSAIAENRMNLDGVVVMDSTRQVDCDWLGEQLGRQVESIELAENFGDAEDSAEAAIAKGAVCKGANRPDTMDFRHAFMPFQGRKRQLQKTAKYLAVAASILVFALGFQLQARLFQQNKPLKKLQQEMKEQYSTIVIGRSLNDPADFLDELENEHRRVLSRKSGQLSASGEKSVAAKLGMVLAAFNDCADKTDLNIESISISSRSIRIVGDTSSQRNTLELRRAIEKRNLQIQKDTLKLEGGRGEFSITLVPGN